MGTIIQNRIKYGEGKDGFSPVVNTKEIENGYRVDIRDAQGNHTFDILNGKNGLSEGKVYTSLNELVLTADATIEDVRGKLQVGESCCIRTDAFTNWSTLFNGIQWGYLKITKTVNALCEIWLNDITSDNGLYYGIQASGKFSKWQKVQTRQTYISLAQMGLTADATIDDVIGALKDGETALISTNEFTNYKDGMFPNQCTNDQYAVIKVEKESGSKVFLEWRQKAGNAYAIGGLDGNNKFTNWDNLVRFKKDGFADDSIVCIGDTVSSDGVIQTLANLGFTTDVMTWDTGVYRVSHVSELTNLPSDLPSAAPGFRLEHHDCKKWGANHNPTTATWAMRHSMLYAEGGKVYHRYTESGATAGIFTKDTGWQQISCGKYYSISHLNSVKGKSIELVANTDNTLKIVEALSPGEEFIEWFGNSNDRFGLGAEAGSRIDYLRIQKTTADNGIILAITDYGKTFTRSYGNSTLRDWTYDKSKTTLVANTSTLKLDITKRNSSWYGTIKLTYLYDTSPVEMEICFRSATDAPTWTINNGQKYVKNVTYTQDSSNTAHYTIGIEFSGTTYGCYQAEVIGGFADINSLTKDAFTGAKVSPYGTPYGKNNGVTLVSAPEDLGLTFPCTSVQLVQAMRNKFNKTINAGAIGIFNNGGKTVCITDAPNDYGLLHIECFGHDRLLIRYDGIGGSSYAGSWIGKVKGSNGTFSEVTWERTDNHYSTGEVAIGTWIDGKTIYRKTFTKSPISNQSTGNQVTIDVATISGLTNVIDIQATAKLQNYNNTSTPIYAKIPFGEIWRSNSGYSGAYVDSVYVEGTTLKLHANSCTSDDIYYVTVEYTK